MSSSDLSLRHLPDLSEASFSFQIPVDSGDNLLHGDSDDFFGGGTSLLASPSSLRANDAPLTLSDLTPIANAIPAEAGPKAPQKSSKSLLTTTRSNIQDLAGSQTASRVPKPVSATHRKPKHVVAALNEIPVHTISVLPSKMVPTSDRSKDALKNENAISPSVHAKQTGMLSTAPDDFSFQLQTIPPTPSIPVSVEDTVEAQSASLDSKTIMRQKFVLPTHTVAPSIPVKNEVEADAAPLDTAPVANQTQTQELATLYPVPISPVSRSPPKAKPVMRRKPQPAQNSTKPRSAVNAGEKGSQRLAKSMRGDGDGHSHEEGAGAGGIAARLLIYGAQMMASFPQSDDEAAESTQGEAEAAMRDNALSSRPAAAPKGGDTRAPRPSDGGIGQTLTLAQTKAEPEVDNRMLVDADLRIVKLEAEPNPVPVPHPEHPTPRDDRLTLSQLSPRKTVVERDDAKRDMDTTDVRGAQDDGDVGMDVDKDGMQHRQRGAPSPMRPSVKRSASALSTVSASADPRGMKRVQGQEQGQEQTQRVPSAVATRGARGRGGLGRGAHSGRVVSAPAQVRPSRQPTRQAREASVTASAGAKSTSTVSVQPAASSRARIAAPKTKETDMSDSRRKDGGKVPRASNGVSTSSSSWLALASGKNPGIGVRNRNATGTSTAPVEFSWQPDARTDVRQGDSQLSRDQDADMDPGEETQPRPKTYTIPDFKALHASQAAQSALRRSQRAPTVPVPIAFSTDVRAREREVFDGKVRERERAAEEARELQRREQEEKEASEVKEMRKRAVPRAHEVPEWYKEAPRRNQGQGSEQ